MRVAWPLLFQNLFDYVILLGEDGSMFFEGAGFPFLPSSSSPPHLHHHHVTCVYIFFRRSHPHPAAFLAERSEAFRSSPFLFVGSSLVYIFFERSHPHAAAFLEERPEVLHASPRDQPVPADIRYTHCTEESNGRQAGRQEGRIGVHKKKGRKVGKNKVKKDERKDGWMGRQEGRGGVKKSLPPCVGTDRAFLCSSLLPSLPAVVLSFCPIVQEQRTKRRKE
jgi:hypothetical protein